MIFRLVSVQTPLTRALGGPNASSWRTDLGHYYRRYVTAASSTADKGFGHA